MNTSSQSSVAPATGWFNWRNALKPPGKYDRRHFLFWFFIPIIVITFVVANIWQLEKALIKASFYLGILKYDIHLLTNILSVALVLFLIYLTALAVFKRCTDLDIAWASYLFWVIPIVNMAYLVYLMFWPGKESHQNPGPHHWPETIVAAIAVFIILAPASFIVEMYLWAVGPAGPSMERSAPVRVWNHTNQPLDVQIATVEGAVTQGYPAIRVEPGDLVRYNEIISRRADYIVKASNSPELITYKAREMPGMAWTFIIPESRR